MTNEQILEKAIKKAVKNGWDNQVKPCDAISLESQNDCDYSLILSNSPPS